MSGASTRVDRWLWAVRVYKTRTLATEACRAGHVRVNGNNAKPASLVRAGDLVAVRASGWERLLEVVAPIDRRVAAPVAAEAVVDRSPPRPPEDRVPAAFAREPGAGRPTKRDRRALDHLRGG